MLKEDVKIERWSAWRDRGRNSLPVALRVSHGERQEIERTAAENMVKTSDVIRASLIYAGVIPEPVQDDDNLGDADGGTVDGSDGSEEPVVGVAAFETQAECDKQGNSATGKQL